MYFYAYYLSLTKYLKFDIEADKTNLYSILERIIVLFEFAIGVSRE